MMSCVPSQNPQPQGGFAAWAEDLSMADRFTTIWSHSRKQPEISYPEAMGCVSMKHHAIAARSISRRLPCLADTKNAGGPDGASGLSTHARRAMNAPGLSILAQTAMAPTKPYATPCEHHNNCRAQLPGLSPLGTARTARGWRNHNVNAHADRCAPLGRNPGGGAQGQPY